VDLEHRLDEFELEALLERVTAMRRELTAAGHEITKAEFVACCKGRPSRLAAPEDVVDLWTRLGAG
jgi:hypothetical protein